jgi:hypothetical protein
MDWFVGTSDQHGPTPWDTLGFPAPGIYILTNSLVGDGWWLTYPSEKYDSPIFLEKKSKNVPKHQPVMVV